MATKTVRPDLDPAIRVGYTMLHACARLRTVLKVVVQDEELAPLYRSTSIPP